MEFIVSPNLKENLFDIIEDINKKNEDDLFYLVDMKDICQKHLNWIKKMPRVIPHYAVKCNGDPILLKILSKLGACFDCASKSEIDKVLALDVDVSRLIFANPCKPSSFIKYAKQVNLDYMTFDNDFELKKIKQNHPDAKCILRIVTDDSNALCKFSSKFGADKATAFKLIDLAKLLDLNLAGVSFHVGSGQLSSEVFGTAIKDSRELFDYAQEKHGIRMHVLDLGGGFPGSDDSGPFFDRITASINKSLTENFPQENFKELRIIAEPGRYYCCSAFTLCTNIISKRVTPMSTNCENAAEHEENMNEKSIMYYINDGIFASFNNILYDHYQPVAELMPKYAEVNDANKQPKKFKSSVWGPTCDGADLILKDVYYPEMNVDDYVIFKNMGAYTISAAVGYNGMPLPRCIYVTPVSFNKDKEQTTTKAKGESLEDIAVEELIKAMKN